ncbi:MAG: hypothetical protein OD918_09040 [Gammaproteobacteria bacterium]
MVEEILAIAAQSIAAQTIAEVRGSCSGIHIMALGWEMHIGALLKRIT